MGRVGGMRRPAGAAGVAALVAAGALAACGDGGTARGGAVRVVAGLAPFAEVAARVGGEHAEVTDLTPAGAEPHDLEVTPRQVDHLADADLVLLVGRGFQPAVEDAADRTAGTVVEVLDALDVPEGSDDPHVWLDPVAMGRVARITGDALATADPEGAAGYRARARALQDELAALHRDFAAGLARCERDLLVTAHESFGWLARRYGLRTEALTGAAPEAEPDPRRLADLADLARDEGVTTVYTEPLVPSGAAETVAREAGGLEVRALDPLESAPAGGYLDAMRANLAALRAGLGCR